MTVANRSEQVVNKATNFVCDRQKTDSLRYSEEDVYDECRVDAIAAERS